MYLHAFLLRLISHLISSFNFSFVSAGRSNLVSFIYVREHFGSMLLVTPARHGQKGKRRVLPQIRGDGVKGKNTIGMDLKDHSTPLWSIPP
jgi:hypothetical protein